MTPTELKQAPPRIQQRYGYPRKNVGWIVLGVLLLAIALGFGSWASLRIGNPPIRAEVLTYDVVDASHTMVTFDVHRPTDATVVCALRAQTSDFLDVGYATVTIEPGTDYVQQTYPVATASKAAYGQLLGCAAAGEPLKVSAPDFPPGTENPPQPWRPTQ